MWARDPQSCLTRRGSSVTSSPVQGQRLGFPLADCPFFQPSSDDLPAQLAGKAVAVATAFFTTSRVSGEAKVSMKSYT